VLSVIFEINGGSVLRNPAYHSVSVLSRNLASPMFRPNWSQWSDSSCTYTDVFGLTIRIATYLLSFCSVDVTFLNG